MPGKHGKASRTSSKKQSKSKAKTATTPVAREDAVVASPLDELVAPVGAAPTGAGAAPEESTVEKLVAKMGDWDAFGPIPTPTNGVEMTAYTLIAMSVDEMSEFEKIGFLDEPLKSVASTGHSPPTFSLAATIEATCAAAGVVCHDVSNVFDPNHATIRSALDFKVDLFKMVAHLQDAVFFVCGDSCPQAAEFLAFDDACKPPWSMPLETLRRRGTPAKPPKAPAVYTTAKLWRGEDFCRVTNTINDAGAVKQLIASLGIGGAMACAVCFEEVHNGDTLQGSAFGAGTRARFTCGHPLCLECAPIITVRCPVCRETRRASKAQ